MDNNKRKRRKTRKCLQEIRKRCKLSLDGSSSNDLTKQKPKPISNITRNRLTMKVGIFAKSVRSETVVRPEFSAEYEARRSENLNKIIDLANGKIKNDTNKYEMPVVNTNKEIIAPQTSSNCEPELIDSPNISSNQESPDVSPLHFSPDRISTQSASESVFSISSSPVSEHTDTTKEEFHYELYQEFITEVPTYINNYFPAVLKEDTLKKMKDYLKKVYKDSCQRESEENYIQCIERRQAQSRVEVKSNKSAIEETIEQSVLLNPINYIKQGCQGNDTANRSSGRLARSRSNLKMLLENLRSENDVDCQKEVLSDSESSSEYLYSTVSESSTSEDNTSFDDNCYIKIVGDSPECTYYPRKLNE